MRILYVEDNPANLFLVQRVARMGNHEVLNYTTGETALENFERDHPDMVLMDVQLAGNMTGLDVVRKLRGSGYKTPIIAVTAYAMIGDRERCMDAGCDDYLAKPLPVPKLVEIIKRYDPLQQNDSLEEVGMFTQPNRPTAEIPRPTVPYPETPPDRATFKAGGESAPQAPVAPATPAAPATSDVEGTKDETIASAASLGTKKAETTTADDAAAAPVVEAKNDAPATPEAPVETKAPEAPATPPVEAKKDDSVVTPETPETKAPEAKAPEALPIVPPAVMLPSTGPLAPTVSGVKYELDELETDGDADAKTEPFKPLNVSAQKED